MFAVFASFWLVQMREKEEHSVGVVYPYTMGLPVHLPADLLGVV